MDEDIAFSRTKDSGDVTVELRGPCLKYVVDVLDAVSSAQNKSRTELVNEILLRYAKAKLHEATVIQRVTRGNPRLSERTGSELE